MTIAMLFVVATPASAKKYGQTLRILAIGNSFSDDGMYLSNIISFIVCQQLFLFIF